MSSSLWTQLKAIEAVRKTYSPASPIRAFLQSRQPIMQLLIIFLQNLVCPFVSVREPVVFVVVKAQEVLENARRDAQLHHAACNFQKRPGKIYYLYEKPNRQTYFSMISPEEWGSSPHLYIGGFRLEMDMSWTPVDEIKRRDEEIQAIDRVLDTRNINEAIRLEETQ
eukprot:m.48243 g.48243  ORF g.48243 m.48243 type:complete len:167 (+) comp33863_c1_seq4:654-1154(+)